jgi:molybdopterin synthase sulfur carrier subunit
MRVQFFGRIGERIGREAEVEVPSGGCSVADLRRRLAELHPAAAADLLAPTLRACIDDEIAGEDGIVREGSDIAFFPPLSGG